VPTQVVPGTFDVEADDFVDLAARLGC
jgi:hypothetical protein